jgi:hypothetical protein
VIRKILLTLVFFAAMGAGFGIFVETFGASLKGTETRSVEVGLGTVRTLSGMGAAMPADQGELDLAFAIKQPVKDELHKTMSRYHPFAFWVIVFGMLGLVVTWWPSQPNRMNTITGN